MSVIEPAQPAAAVVPAAGDARALTVVKPSPRIVQFTPKPPPAPPSKDRDSYAFTALADIIDRSLHAFVARFTAGLSPTALGGAYFDWAIHLAYSPGKQVQLVEKAARKGVRFANYAARCAIRGPQEEPASSRCRRTTASPARLGSTGRTTSSTRPSCSTSSGGTTRRPAFAASPAQHERHGGVRHAPVPRHVLAVELRRSPIPRCCARTVANGGMNLVHGPAQLRRGLGAPARAASKPVGAEHFVVGRDVAVTPGKVVYRNRLIELIQYAPATGTVRPEPVLIVPAWIMKYYILDLSPENSLVRYLVEQGYTVFMISWKNPGPEDRDLGVGRLPRAGRDGRARRDRRDRAGRARCTPSATASAARCCRSPPRRWRATATTGSQSMTLFAAQTDFTEAGELMLFINESQVAFLEDTDVGAGLSRHAARWPAPSRCCAPTISSGRAWSTST